jgi:hypothetical protein
MKSNLIYFAAGLPRTGYDVRRAFEIDDYLLHEELPRMEADKDVLDYHRDAEKTARKRLAELGLPNYGYGVRGFGFNGKKIGEFNRPGPYAQEVNGKTTYKTSMSREIYKTKEDGIYVFDDHLLQVPDKLESFIGELLHARIVSELRDVKKTDLEGILAKLKKVDNVPLVLYNW